MLTEAPRIDLSKVLKAYKTFTGLAERLGLSLSTVHGWQQRGNIPAWRAREIAAAAEADGHDVIVTPRKKKARSKVGAR